MRPMKPLALGALLALASAATASAQHHGRGAYGNPADLDAYIARLADPARDAWQKPDEVIRHLALRPGQVACDVGSGPGYFTLRLARAVAPGGHVYAVDVEPKILDALRTRLLEAKTTNVVPVLALGHDPLLPERACDLILVVDTYHHFPDRVSYLRRLGRSLKPGGRLVNIDFEKKPTPVGPPMDHRLAREVFLGEAEQGGFVVAEQPALLPHQYFVVLKAR
jgi:SAM-dependent methyltransferase